jgi:hypothetical protein
MKRERAIKAMRRGQKQKLIRKEQGSVAGQRSKKVKQIRKKGGADKEEGQTK